MFRRTGLFLLIGVPLIALVLFVLAWLTGARAQDNNPFSGAREIRVVMTLLEHGPCRAKGRKAGHHHKARQHPPKAGALKVCPIHLRDP
jgi:hypothetical protein